MELSGLTRIDDYTWRLDAAGAMRVPGILYGDRGLIRAMDDKVRVQLSNVASLPGIVGAAYAMPDAHWGYGFPIGGVAAFDPEQGGVVSAGGVGFDISCGVRTMTTGLSIGEIRKLQSELAHELGRTVPAGLGSTGGIHLSSEELDAMLTGGARWSVERGYGRSEDLERIEERGALPHAKPAAISLRARHRQRDEMGTLGSGNHYLEIQLVGEVFQPGIAAVYGLTPGNVVVTIHCGSRGLGHQIGTEYLQQMVLAAPSYGIRLPDRELACAPIKSDLGRDYLGAMRAAANCALANRQIITHLVRGVFARFFPGETLPLLYDVSHNMCRQELHVIDGAERQLYVHRKGATRAFGPGHAELPAGLRETGQPVLIGGSMGTASYILAGTGDSEQRAMSSACHGAGRSMSRHAATRTWRGRTVVDELSEQGITVISPTMRGVAEEAPGAYKSVDQVVEAADAAGLARKVARLTPVIVVKG
jgi:tRNA-splicing ligase RtcB (3'-phosphate/5'-hydroxy nucleic acid ligase)